MKKLGIFGVVLSVALGCGASDESLSGDEQNQTGQAWSKIIDCDGLAVIDVDTRERRNLQLVVRDPSAFATLDRTIPYGQIKNSRERIYRGTSPYGIFSAPSFRHFRAYEVVRNAAGQSPGIDVIREGQGIRVRALDLSRPGCQPHSLNTSPPDDNYPAECEVANYVFPQCR